ncbi:MAG: hypothetical protein SFY69_08840 [Planctomycetota bacterium]|nr:hypothetical protein [Planctomycetota bacterium]
MNTRRVIRGIIAWGRRPVGAGVVLALLALDVTLMTAAFRHDSIAGRVILDGLAVRYRPRESTFDITVVAWADGREVVMYPDGSAGEIAEAISQNPDRVLRVWYVVYTRRTGYVAPWNEFDGRRLWVERVGDTTPATPADIDRARRIMCTWLGAQGHADLAADCAAPDYDRRSPTYWGPAHDVLFALVALWAISNIPFAVVSAWRARRAGTLRRGVCPACRYDIRGTPADLGMKRCPECGRVWRMPE